MTRAAVRPHADQLQHVTCLLRVLERPQVVRVVGAPIALERCEHGQHRVGGGQRLGVVRLGGDVVRALRVGSTSVRVRPQPVGGRAPREQKRNVPGIAVLVGPVVRREGLVEPSPEVQEQPHAPREARWKHVGMLGCALEAAERLVPVAADLERLARERVDRRRSELGWKPLECFEHRLNGTARQEGAAMGREELRGLGWRRQSATGSEALPPAPGAPRTSARRSSVRRASPASLGDRCTRANSRTGAPSEYQPAVCP